MVRAIAAKGDSGSLYLFLSKEENYKLRPFGIHQGSDSAGESSRGVPLHLAIPALDKLLSTTSGDLKVCADGCEQALKLARQL